MSRYRHEMPLDLQAPLPAGIAGENPQPSLPVPRPSPHEPGCWCIRCWNAGIDYGVYLHNKRMNEL